MPSTAEPMDTRIETFEDLMRILRSHPDWLATMRELVLTTELIDLPRKFDEFLKGEFRPLASKVDRMDSDISALKHDVSTLQQDVSTLKEDVRILKIDVAGLKGSDFERTIREKAPAYFGRLLRRCRVVHAEPLSELLEEAEEAGRITSEDFDEALRVDLVVRGEMKADRRPVMLAVEASTTVDRGDVERAHRRAEIIGRAAGSECIGVAIGMPVTKGAAKLAEEIGVLLV